MTKDERNALIATAGLVLAVVGTFLPWARIGGRNRSGFNTADTFISLADGALPSQLAWLGRWWYVPAVLLLVSWATTFVGGHVLVRATGVLAVTVSMILWWLFVWSGHRYDLVEARLLGPVSATVGSLIIGYSCSRVRGSTLRPVRPPAGPNAPNEVVGDQSLMNPSEKSGTLE